MISAIKCCKVYNKNTAKVNAVFEITTDLSWRIKFEQFNILLKRWSVVLFSFEMLP